MYFLPSTEIEYTIRLRQRSVTNFQYRLNGPDMWRKLTPDEDDLACITRLQLLLTDKEGFEHIAVLLDCAPNVASLDLEVNRKAAIATADQLPSPAQLARGPRILKSLRMKFFHLAAGRRTVAGLVRLEELKELQLIECKEYDYLLKDIKSLALPLQLKAFCIEESDWSSGSDHFPNHLNDVLRLLSSPARISVSLASELDTTTTILDWSVLQNHALKYLRVDYHWTTSPFPTQRC